MNAKKPNPPPKKEVWKCKCGALNSGPYCQQLRRDCDGQQPTSPPPPPKRFP